MSIVNPMLMLKYDELEPKLRQLCDEVILNKSENNDHVERFLEYAEEVRNVTRRGQARY
jgi:5-methyltetrahydrofolate--homocysteine methyltransferase